MTQSILYSLAASIAVCVPLYAYRVRGRVYAIFSAVILSMSLPGLLISHERFASWLPSRFAMALDWVYILCILAAGVHLSHLVRARMRSRAFRWGVSVPGQATIASGFMMGVWLLALLPLRALLLVAGFDSLLDMMRWLDLAPIVIAIGSIATSSRPGPGEIVRVRLGDDRPEAVTRVPVERFRGKTPHPAGAPTLRIAQITDPHLGPWQTVASLRGTLDRLLANEPDLVLLTGDFLTMESNGTPGALSDALAPLQDRRGDCFAIFGNHDHEAPELVREAMAANDIQMLVDEEAVARTRVGDVQIIGADYVGQGRGEHVRGLLDRYPRGDHALRLLLLHDPLGFHSIEPGGVDLTLSGHTHGGQVGLVSLGFDWTVLSRSRWPDHGLFGLGPNRLYVHRGTGFYGFPLRVGVPGEASILEWVLE